MFTSLLMAGTFLGRLTGWLVDGVPFGTIVEAFMLLLPGIMAKTFSMAVLLAALLSFGRLSSDSEIVALRAGGASIPRIVLPVAGFSLVVALATFAFNEMVVPGATQRSLELANRIAKEANPNRNSPVTRNEVQKGKLRLAIVAQNANPANQTLQGVTLVSYDDTGKENLILMAKELQFSSAQNWRILGGATLLAPDGSSVSRISGEVWPEGVATPTQSFTDLVKPRDDDFDAQSMAQLRRTIDQHRERGSRTEAQLANYEYGYWNKISVPLAAIVFGTLGAVLGIRNHRTGTAAGFALAVAIIFGYMVVANFMAIWAQGGVIPSWVASFAPLAIGSALAIVFMWRRNA